MDSYSIEHIPPRAPAIQEEQMKVHQVRDENSKSAAVVTNLRCRNKGRMPYRGGQRGADSS